MAKRINPARSLLWRNSTDLQLGLDQPVVLHGVTAEEERWLNLLQRGIADEAVTSQQLNLIQRIAPALVDFGSVRKPRLSHDYMQGAFAELIRASFATNRDGVSVLESRAAVTVQLDSLGNGGLLVALGLCAAGIGRIITEDLALVSAQEVNPLGYRKSQVGARHIDAIREILKERNSPSVIEEVSRLTPAKRRSKLKVLVTGNALDPRRFRGLVDEHQPHLCVFFETSRVSVSPVVTDSPCLGCLDEAKRDADPAWPALASQLIGRIEYLEDARSALFASAMVVGEIVQRIDDPEAEREFVGHRLSIASGTVTEWRWAKHPNCYCSAEPA